MNIFRRKRATPHQIQREGLVQDQKVSVAERIRLVQAELDVIRLEVTKLERR